MDKGAHFFRCDFQVHTPRDGNWTGAAAVADTERRAYAEELVLACRRKQLQAIAITDHHDFTFFPFVRAAAHAEIDDRGKPIDPSERLIVFPGIELTLTAPSCQALLILDADFPENLLQSVLVALAITPTPPTDARLGPVQRVPQNVVTDLSNLYEILNQQAHLRGRFIVLPNVTETGHGTLLRSGFANFYKSMPCVGAYTDGAVPGEGTGNHSILSGQNRDYGFKAVAVLQTSDNRRRDHRDLGKHSTWVKWAEPTAEALRQACLARESRLSQGVPGLPSMWIQTMSVSNSRFLGRIEIDFNQQYNTVIGGRGTGKSTILEYLRWGLCDQPADHNESDLALVQTKRKKLIDDTLQPLDGEVIVTFVVNGVMHVVKRNSKTSIVQLKIGDQSFAEATEQEIRNLIPLQAYSQKQLSSVGVRNDELKRFVESPIRQALIQLRETIRGAEAKVRTAYAALVRQRELVTERSKYEIEIDSLTKQVAALRKSLKGLSEEDQQTIKLKSAFDSEEVTVSSYQNEIDRLRELVDGVAEGAGSAQDIELDEADAEGPNADLVKKIRSATAAKLKEVLTRLRAVSALFDDASMKALVEQIRAWETSKEKFDKKYEAAKSRAAANQQQLKQIADAEKRLSELKRLLVANQNALKALGDPSTIYATHRRAWIDAQKKKGKLISEQCSHFSALSSGLIEAKISGIPNEESIKRAFRIALTGLNVRDQKIDAMYQHIAEAPDPLAAWATLITELESLVLQKLAGDKLPPTPNLDLCNFKDAEKQRILSGLDSERWLTLSLAELEFTPSFLYSTNRKTDEHIDFADASAGQQATALLTVLLNQSGAPLVIDQPEDDLDSKMSQEIVRQIWQAKRGRQLVFASHNANLVVNGDSDLVLVCDYVRSGDQTGGKIKAVGAIDSPAIKEEITSVTEGGKEAFKLRKEKYGF